jgi:peptidyl-prolyl cis-trans isomerase SurA
MTPASSQSVADETVPEATFDIPGGGQLLAKPSDPNVRKATAIVNGEIITGTEVDSGSLSSFWPTMVNCR